MNLATAKKLCSEWHSGQASPFYQFASSGVWLEHLADGYIAEAEDDINLTKSVRGKAPAQLIYLRNYFVMLKKQFEKAKIK